MDGVGTTQGGIDTIGERQGRCSLPSGSGKGACASAWYLHQGCVHAREAEFDETVVMVYRTIEGYKKTAMTSTNGA